MSEKSMLLDDEYQGGTSACTIPAGLCMLEDACQRPNLMCQCQYKYHIWALVFMAFSILLWQIMMGIPLSVFQTLDANKRRCQMKKQLLTVASEVKLVDKVEENEVSVFLDTASSKIGITKSSLFMLTFKSPLPPTIIKWLGSLLAQSWHTLFFVQMSQALPTKFHFVGLVHLTITRNSYIVVSKPLGATLLMNCTHTPVEVWLAVGKDSNSKQVDKTGWRYLPLLEAVRLRSCHQTKPELTMHGELHGSMQPGPCRQDKHENYMIYYWMCCIVSLGHQVIFLISMLCLLNSIYVEYLAKVHAFTWLWLPKLCEAVIEVIFCSGTKTVTHYVLSVSLFSVKTFMQVVQKALYNTP